MTDKEALDIIAEAKTDDIDAFWKAFYIAAKKLEECQWHDYVEGDYLLAFETKVILGIRYDDGSRGSVNGVVLYDMEKGCYLTIHHKAKSYLTDNAVIEKWMKYPDYN